MTNQKRNRIKEAKSYFRATEAVSKPIAFLMLFFALSFLISVCVGMFLFGRWGYRQLTNVDKPTVVVSDSTTGATIEQPSNINSDPNSNNKEPNQSTGTVVVDSGQASSTAAMPNTGASPYVYLILVGVGALFHSGYIRIRR